MALELLDDFIELQLRNTRIDKIVIAIINIKADFAFFIFHHPDKSI